MNDLEARKAKAAATQKLIDEVVSGKRKPQSVKEVLDQAAEEAKQESEKSNNDS